MKSCNQQPTFMWYCVCGWQRARKIHKTASVLEIQLPTDTNYSWLSSSKALTYKYAAYQHMPVTWAYSGLH